MTKSKLFTFLLAVLILAAAVPVFAGPIPSKAVSHDRAADLAAIHDVVAIQGVTAALEAQGLTTDQVNQRLANLSDQDLHNLAQNVEQIQAAGITREQWIWIGIGALAVALLVALTS